jgi:hypothetical protein
MNTLPMLIERHGDPWVRARERHRRDRALVRSVEPLLARPIPAAPASGPRLCWPSSPGQPRV